MKVGIISPIDFLSKYCITDIQYCLPKLLVDSKEYRDFYIGRQKKGNTLILDCRKLTWKREPEDFRVIKEALKIINPSIIITPSYMFNLKGTKEIYKEFKKVFKSDKILRCLEGTSEEDIKKYPKDESIAIPSHMYRYALKKPWGPQTVFIENHLSLEELDGMDGILVTSLPIKLGLQGRLLSDYLPSPPSLTFYEEEDKYPEITAKNVEETIEYYKS